MPPIHEQSDEELVELREKTRASKQQAVDALMRDADELEDGQPELVATVLDFLDDVLDAIDRELRDRRRQRPTQ